MTRKTQNAVGAAEKAVTRLVAECCKGGALYVQSPQAVAQVSRTSKWLLNALARLRRELGTHDGQSAS